MIRLVHLSDVHITTRPLGWERHDWFNKRLPGWINFAWLGRAHRFRQAELALTALVAELHERPPDRVVFSGDATAMGFAAEFARAADLLQLTRLPGLAVPGNHDYYTPASAAAGMFERYFAPWLQGERIDGAVYPFAQRVGDDLWLIAVNSCTGNRWAWDASGQVDAAQLERLERLLASLAPGPRILVTHYPVCLASGRCERRSHGLRNLSELVAVAARGGVGLWLHGHRHGHYHLPQPSGAPFPVICAGSATQTGLWSYFDYTVEGRSLHATRRVFHPDERRFRDDDTFSVKIV